MSEPYVWRAIGGHPVLDLANTVSWRLDPDRRVDHLATPTDVASWATALDVVDGRQARRLLRAMTADPEAARGLLSQVVRLRGAVEVILDATADGRPMSSDAVEAVRRSWEAALSRAEVVAPVPLRWSSTLDTPQGLADLLALSAGDLLRSPDVARVRRCGGPGCGWFFLDATRNHSRRWCDTADCGNRVRGQRHRAKVVQTARR